MGVKEPWCDGRLMRPVGVSQFPGDRSGCSKRVDLCPSVWRLLQGQRTGAVSRMSNSDLGSQHACIFETDDSSASYWPVQSSKLERTPARPNRPTWSHTGSHRKAAGVQKKGAPVFCTEM